MGIEQFQFMKKLRFLELSILLFSFMLASCTVETEPISYGKENCNFCKMTIMDNKFGCELVTKKGKVFKFDDLSCMIKYMKISEINEKDFSLIVVNQHDKPGDLIDVKNAAFITSPNMATPMMGNTAALIDKTKVDELLKNDKAAKKITWNELVESIK